MILQTMYNFFGFPGNCPAFPINEPLLLPVKVGIFFPTVICVFIFSSIAIFNRSFMIAILKTIKIILSRLPRTCYISFISNVAIICTESQGLRSSSHKTIGLIQKMRNSLSSPSFLWESLFDLIFATETSFTISH